MRIPKIRATLPALVIALALPIVAVANENTDRLVKDLDKTDCAKLGAKMQSFLEQNKARFAALSTLPMEERKKQVQAYRKAFDKAETATTKCESGRAKEVEARLSTVGADPRHIVGIYARITATLDFVLQTNSNDPYAYEQLTKSYEDLLAGYQRVAKTGKPTYN